MSSYHFQLPLLTGSRRQEFWYYLLPKQSWNLQDRAAKFVDQLSAIGGTMGLLTGFSLISAVEIIYFMVKITLQIMRDPRTH